MRCVKCHSKLECETLLKDKEIQDGFLHCKKCGLIFPIIGTIPILWNDFTAYLSNRPRLGGELLVHTKAPKMRSFIKKTLSMVRKTASDSSIIEKRWAGIYAKNHKSQFYSTIKKSLDFNCKISLEHGCSIGVMTKHLARNSDLAFGIDKSYYGIMQAKKSPNKNLDFFVADSLEQPFGKARFDLVLGLNLFELIEPRQLIRLLAGQTQKNGTLVLSDPYDFDRGVQSVREPLYEDTIRKEITKLKFAISKQTRKPSFHPWILKMYDRASLHYLVDVIIAKKL